MELILTPNIKKLIELSLEEDIGRGDITSESIFPPFQQSQGIIITKQSGVICGLPLIKWIFDIMNEEAEIAFMSEEGAQLQSGEDVVLIKARTNALLIAERTILNFLQHLSGIATKSRRLFNNYSKLLRITDTRKTLPGWRRLQKYAVMVGGLYNHRYDLGSGILIKDNHITAAGSISNAIKLVKKHAPHGLKIEVEVKNLKELDEAVKQGADIVLLDNMNDEMIEKAVKRYKGKVLLEASGSITENRLESLSNIGIDIVSMGVLTHTVTPLDLSMKFV